MEDVNSSVEEVNEVTKRLKVSIPATLVSREYNEALKNFSKTTQLKGFRKGAAPHALVEKLHGSRVQMEVANKLIFSSLENLVREHKIEMVGHPEIDISSYEAGKELHYTADISIFPVPTVTQYDKFKVKVKKREVTNEDVDKVIERFRESRATLRKNELRTTAQIGDVIDGTIVIEVDGKPSSRPEPLAMRLGDNETHEDLEKGIVGMSVGDTRSITIHQENKETGEVTDVIYKVSLLALQDKILPEVNDEFAKTVDPKTQTLLELRVKVREDLEAEQKREGKSDVHTAILDELLTKNQFLVPQVIIDDEIRGILIRYRAVDQSKVHRYFPVDQFREQLGESALKRVRTAIIVDRIAEQEKLRASEEEYNSSIKEIASQSKLNEDEVRKYFDEQGRKSSQLLELTRTKVLDFLYGRTEVSYEQ